MATKLMEEGADVNAVDNCGKTPLGLLKLITMKAKLDKKEELFKALNNLCAAMEERGAVVDWKDEDKSS
jgi:hypothetical protein